VYTGLGTNGDDTPYGWLRLLYGSKEEPPEEHAEVKSIASRLLVRAGRTLKGDVSPRGNTSMPMTSGQ
jgi:hypothetical protein